jgi:hypothetical protein
MQKIVTEGERAANEALGAPERISDTTANYIGDKLNREIDNRLNDNKYLGKVIRYTGDSGISGSISDKNSDFRYIDDKITDSLDDAYKEYFE